MKLFFLLLLLFFLGGCSFIVEGSTSSALAHQFETEASLSTDDFILVHSQAELEEALWGMITQHTAQQQFRISHFNSSIARALISDAIHAVWSEPLGAYAVNMFTPHILTEAPGLLEFELTIQFDRTADEIASVRTIHTGAFFHEVLESTLRAETDHVAFLVPANIANVNFIESLILAAYYSQALDLVLLPQFQINLYPSIATGPRRIVELMFDFGFSLDELTGFRDDLQSTVSSIANIIPDHFDQAQRVLLLSNTLSSRAMFDPIPTPQPDPNTQDFTPNLSDTAFGALVSRRASSEGFSMAMLALLSYFDIPAHIVFGELAGNPHAWNLIYIDGAYYHFDVSMLREHGPQSTLFVSDEAFMFQYGYTWDILLYPRADSALRYSDFS